MIPCRTTLEVIIPSRDGVFPEQCKDAATLCPLHWPSNYSLLRLWHMHGSLQKTENDLRSQTGHNHMFASWTVHHHLFADASCFAGLLCSKLQLSCKTISVMVYFQIGVFDSDPRHLHLRHIDMEKPAQWVTKMCRLYFADIYARKTKGIPTSYPAPGVEDTLREVQQLLPDLEAKMIEFLAEWIVTLLSPATQIVKARAFHLTFMFVKEYWFRDFYLGLKVTASLDREESYTRIIDGQVRCITQEHIQKGKQLIWNVEFLTIFVPAWMIPPIYHSLRRECIKNAAHSHPYGVRSVRPSWFEDSKIPSQPGRSDSTPFQPMHGLKLVIKEDVTPQEQMPHFLALEMDSWQ